MGEYGLYKGNEIKIGTCESMYYLRADQIDLVTSRTLNDITSLLFRFPFPDEDHIEPGAFDPYNRGFPVRLDPPSDDALHHSVQFRASAGVLVMLPCPLSDEGKATGLKYMFNGFPGPMLVKQQRAWAGVWATVMSCSACEGTWRLPERSDALPIIEALILEGDRRAIYDKTTDRTYHEIAARIAKGYETKVDRDPTA